jgi:hypothetical protein
MPTFALTPLPAPLPASPEGKVRRVVVDEAHSYPCRRCLRDAEPGERVLLLSYDPFPDGAESPYRQPGPIFVHERVCAHEPNGALPDQLTRRLLSVRSFDAGHLMLGGAVVDGSQLEATAERLLDDHDVSYLHVHNAGPGCFAVRIDRDT